MGGARQDRAMPENTTRRQVRRPHDIGTISRAELFAWFEELSAREIRPLRAGMAPPADEMWTHLAVQARLESEITGTRWLLVAHLLRSAAARSWWEIADALGMTNAEAARAEFAKWITSQVDLHQRSPDLGLADDTAIELREFAHALPLNVTAGQL